MREVLWERLRRTEIEQAAKAGAVVIIPIASLEQHANHLPVNTDSNIVSTIARRAAEAVQDFPVLVLPTIWTGYSPHHMAYPGSVTLKHHTFVDVLTQVAGSVHAHGFRKILLLNGHGGNSSIVAGMRTKLAHEDGVSVIGCDYWGLPTMPEAMRRLCQVDRGFVGHSGEFETSVQLYLQPELVDTREAVWAPGAFGDPSAGTAEKGKGLVQAAVEALVSFLGAYHSGEVEDRLQWRKEAPER
jgi:creatinine amidohydrolase